MSGLSDDYRHSLDDRAHRRYHITLRLALLATVIALFVVTLGAVQCQRPSYSKSSDDLCYVIEQDKLLPHACP